MCRLDPDTRLGCGTEDFVRVWSENYEPANLRETYSWLGVGQAGYTARAGNSSRVVRQADWVPLPAWSAPVPLTGETSHQPKYSVRRIFIFSFVAKPDNLTVFSK